MAFERLHLGVLDYWRSQELFQFNRLHREDSAVFIKGDDRHPRHENSLAACRLELDELIDCHIHILSAEQQSCPLEIPNAVIIQRGIPSAEHSSESPPEETASV